MHMCQKCRKQLGSRQSLWNHKQSCRRYGPPDDLHEVCVGQKTKAHGEYNPFSANRFPSIVMPPSCKRPRTKGDIVGYSDDDETQEKSKFDGARKAKTLAILDRIVNSPQKSIPSHVISKIPVIPSGVVENELDSTISKGKGMWLSRGHGVDGNVDDKDEDVDDDKGVSKTTKKEGVAKKHCSKLKKKTIYLLEEIVKDLET